jgi:hypothetical protein
MLCSTYFTGHKVHDAFQIKRGSYTDLPAAKISEMMHSSSLDVRIFSITLYHHFFLKKI